MKKSILLLLASMIIYPAMAQEYDIAKLKTVSKIWGEIYLFHPSIVRADKTLNWEKQLLEFLPKIKNPSTSDEFIDLINSGMLSVLEDPLTAVQTGENRSATISSNLRSNEVFDYLKLSEDSLSKIESLRYFDSIISDKLSMKPLVLDCRISAQLQLDWHSFTPFQYFLSMFISQEIPLCQSVTREHFGWDEYNEWWFYEQRWKIAQEDLQQKNSGHLMPFLSYQQTLQRKLPDFNFESFSTISRPVYFIVNKSFMSYYESSLMALQLHRTNTNLIFEDSGKIFSGHNGLIKYEFQNFDFILNSSLFIAKNTADLNFEFVSPVVTFENIHNLLQSDLDSEIIKQPFSFQISPVKDEDIRDGVTMEEKLLGVIKIWTIVKYFYPYLNNCREDWNGVLESYLKKVQQSHSDKEYYTQIQEMMSILNDSHVSTFHPSLLDFSNIFVAPVKFEWIGNKIIVTAIDSSVQADIHVGDEILSINNETINNILQKESKIISSSNNQGLLATVIHPGNYTNSRGSIMTLGIRDGGGQKNIEIPRTANVFQFMGFGDKRPSSLITDGNIGYLNLAALTNAPDLEKELLNMKNTKSLILDLRNSYPTADYHQFLQMLCQEKVITRQSKVPVISAKQTIVWQFDINETSPHSMFTYNKPVAVLVDKSLISRPEDIALCLSAFQNVIFIGEQTQGTDGEMTKIHLPGGGETSFTGQIIKFGDGKLFQHNGILPDIEVNRTVKGIMSNRDEILEKAIEILEDK